MISELFTLTRPLFVFDTETTGVDVNVDRIVEIGFQQWGPLGIDKEWRSLVNPGIPIPAEVTAIHGITDAMMQACRECGLPRELHYHNSTLLVEDRIEAEVKGPDHDFKPVPLFAQLALNLQAGFQNCDFAGKNIRFDLRLLAAEFARLKLEWSYAGARIIDAERLEQLAVPRTLSHLHEKYTGAKHDGAHGALSDVRASATVIAAQLMDHASLPRDLDALHALQWPGWIDGEGKFRFVNGEARFGQWGKYAGQPLRKADNGYWDWILSAAFPPDVKAIAREAKLGRFPQEKK